MYYENVPYYFYIFLLMISNFLQQNFRKNSISDQVLKVQKTSLFRCFNRELSMSHGKNRCFCTSIRYHVVPLNAANVKSGPEMSKFSTHRAVCFAV